uniref:Cytoplasmic protein n=1 Tax=Panagrellus redivivus TaxID=6233 RepID=A0A7E4UV85_PANRE
MELLAFANKQEQCFHCFLTIKSSPEDNIAGIMDEVKLKMSTGFNEHANDGQVHVTCGDTTLCFVPKTFA